MKLGALALTAMTLSGCSDGHSAFFSDLAAAKAAGMIERGWIPAQLPPDAIDIQVRWNLDTNLSEGTYASKMLIDEEQADECQAVVNEPAATRCGDFVFRTRGHLRSFSNRGRTS